MAEILRDIGMIARALDSISNIEFKEVDLTRGQYLYLVRICENPGIIQEKLAEMIKVDRTTTARAIKKLESNGMIERLEDKENKKIKKLYPTKKGAEIYPFIIEAKQLEYLLKKVCKNVSEDWNFVKKGNKRIY
ncbi:MarR family transcriptional regulator [Enterococcus lactis]|uniref:MarR family transcriptional regulator n=1 Tax=Enterococcus lactis TaxID=357441 RepID=UPI0022E758F7|nr:MarR family transcriptional regulator [Enterococcus lactis]